MKNYGFVVFLFAVLMQSTCAMESLFPENEKIEVERNMVHQSNYNLKQAETTGLGGMLNCICAFDKKEELQKGELTLNNIDNDKIFMTEVEELLESTSRITVGTSETVILFWFCCIFGVGLLIGRMTS
jgi:hypothetical protein